MKKILCLLIFAKLLENSYAQSSRIDSNTDNVSVKSYSSGYVMEGGIKWSEGLSWQEVKAQAAREQRYVFLDCFTTWCGPCKMMDEQVYKNDSVGDFFNKHFINVKVQLDKTKKDNSYVKSWYIDADSIGKKYRIEAFPCFIFMSPNGNLLHQGVGYTGVSKLLNMAQLAIQPGKVYINPYGEYDSLLVDFRKGIIHYDRMWYMIKTAQKFDPVIVPLLTDKYEKYISSLADQQRYGKDVIQFMASKVAGSQSSSFLFFNKNARAINEVMKQKGYAESVIDKAIYNEIIVPFFNEQNKNKIIPMTGPYLNGIQPDYSEADWKKLTAQIRQKFNNSIAKRNLLAAKIEWYQRHYNIYAACRFKLKELKKYPPDLNSQSIIINLFAWNAFTDVIDKKILNGYIQWMRKVVLVKNYPEFLDTYANLLYKIGKRDEAIIWEQKAAEVGKESGDFYKAIIEQMKRGEATYDVKL